MTTSDSTAVAVVAPVAREEPLPRVRSAASVVRREKVKAALDAISGGTLPALAIKRAGLTAKQFFRILRASPSLDRAYELSRQACAQVLADQGLALAAHLSRQTDITPSKVMSLKLRLDYLKWYIGTLYPKTFKDRLEGDSSARGQVTVVVVMDDRKAHAVAPGDEVVLAR